MADEKDKQVDRLCQLFKGRLNKAIALELIEEYGGSQEAASFLMQESPDKVRDRLKQNAKYVKDLQKDAEKFQETLGSGKEDMQFACKACDRMWWKRVPKRKQVSRCFRCHIKYDPIPKEHQWGWGVFGCPARHCFKGFGIMGRTKSRCYKCNGQTEADMMSVIPPKKRGDGDRKRPKRNCHNCNGINCKFSRGYYQPGNTGKPPVCIHPHSQPPGEPLRIHWASNIHVSTGSTFVTILDQGSLNTKSTEPARSLVTIPEKGDQ